MAVGESPWELYDLGTDRCESHNLAAAHPEKVKQLEQAWNAHAEEFRRSAHACPAACAWGKAKHKGQKLDSFD